MSLYPRTSNRLKGFDYSQARSYFVTICLRTRSDLFGHISAHGILVQSDIGNMIARSLISIPDTLPHVDIVDFVVMPDHVHIVVELANDGSETVLGLGTVIGRFKGMTRHRYSLGVASRGWPRYEMSFWEQGFHDHIIRDDADFANCMNYIEQNPTRWAEKRRERL